MKKYSTLILSFIFSIIVFVVLIYVQKSIINQEELMQVYIVKQNVNICDNITIDMLDVINISKNQILSTDIFTNTNILENVVANKKLSKGKILLNEDLLNKSELENYISSVYTQQVIIPISSVDNSISSIANDNNYVDVYITAESLYEPDNISEYEKVNNKNTSTFLYIQKAKPICFLDDNGNILKNKGLAKSVVLELNQKQALYINYIKGKAVFNLTLI